MDSVKRLVRGLDKMNVMGMKMIKNMMITSILTQNTLRGLKLMNMKETKVLKVLLKVIVLRPAQTKTG